MFSCMQVYISLPLLEPKIHRSCEPVLPLVQLQ